MKERVEKIVTIIGDRELSCKYPTWGCAFDFKDNDGNRYEWNTKIMVDSSICKGRMWKIKMTIASEKESLTGMKRILVERVTFVKLS